MKSRWNLLLVVLLPLLAAILYGRLMRLASRYDFNKPVLLDHRNQAPYEILKEFSTGTLAIRWDGTMEEVDYSVAKIRTYGY